VRTWALFWERRLVATSPNRASLVGFVRANYAPTMAEAAKIGFSIRRIRKPE
jgi:hypothetical protein